MRIILALFLIYSIDAHSAEPTLDQPVDAPRAQSPKRKIRNTNNSGVRPRGLIAGGIGIVAEKSNDNRNYEPRTLFLGRLGLEQGPHEFLLELGGFKQETGTSGITVSRFHQQLDLWYHYSVFQNAPVGHPYLGIGIGAQRDEVTTTLFGSTAKAEGAFEAQLSVGGGYRLELGDVLAVWLEGRLATSQNYEPRILPSAIATIGLRLK